MRERETERENGENRQVSKRERETEEESSRVVSRPGGGMAGVRCDCPS